jgi:hypothetical protein
MFDVLGSFSIAMLPTRAAHAGVGSGGRWRTQQVSWRPSWRQRAGSRMCGSWRPPLSCSRCASVGREMQRHPCLLAGPRADGPLPPGWPGPAGPLHAIWATGGPGVVPAPWAGAGGGVGWASFSPLPSNT